MLPDTPPSSEFGEPAGNPAETKHSGASFLPDPSRRPIPSGPAGPSTATSMAPSAALRLHQAGASPDDSQDSRSLHRPPTNIDPAAIAADAARLQHLPPAKKARPSQQQAGKDVNSLAGPQGVAMAPLRPEGPTTTATRGATVGLIADAEDAAGPMRGSHVCVPACALPEVDVQTWASQVSTLSLPTAVADDDHDPDSL